MIDQRDAKELVVRAGMELVRSGLIARTWGNVSCRIDDTTFAITPSGRAYETLTPDDIVICKVSDASYEGNIKPSSEKGIHALVYQKYSDIGFVIHTHQTAASAISITKMDKMPSLGRVLLGDGVPIAAYGLPGTKKLKKGVANALKKCTGKAVIMAHHGALCFGHDYNETFDVAQKLEAACYDFLINTYIKKSGAASYKEDEFFSFCSGTKAPTPLYLFSSKRTSDGFILESELDDQKTHFKFTDTNLSGEAQIHKEIYTKRKDINFIEQDMYGGLLEISQAQAPLLPWLDDFAQIAGLNARCSQSMNPEHVVKALRGRMGVLVPGAGAFCCAGNESDVQAMQLVMEKNALAQMSANLLKQGHPLNLLDCHVMNLVYKISYSKKAEAN